MPAQLVHTPELSRDWMESKLFPLCDSIRDGAAVNQRLEGRALYCLFYEPSFLTRASFERAMGLLGGNTQHTEDASQFFPVRTTAHIEDTIKFLKSLHFDAVVIRSGQQGAVEDAAAAGIVTVINGGSPEDHPTQGLLDIYTFHRELGRVDGIKVAVVGRLDHRNVNALLMALALFEDIQVTLVPLSGQANQTVIEHCSNAGVTFAVESELLSSADLFDAIYVNGAETPSHANLVKSRNMVSVKVDEELLAALRPDCVILDPMQRNELIVTDTGDPRWAGYRQAENGLYVRMGLLMELLGN